VKRNKHTKKNCAQVVFIYKKRRKKSVCLSGEAVLKQLDINAVACRNESTNFYIRQFFHETAFALLSVSAGRWKPSEQTE
jgi:hypothetical protein